MHDSYEQEMEQLTKASYDEEVAFQFIQIASDEDSDPMELPAEKNGTILLSTIQAQYPDAIGLKYKSSTGGLRGIRAADNVLDPPPGGWGEKTYLITTAPLKRKAAESASNGNNGTAAKVTKLKKGKDYLGDLIVLGLPFATTETEFEEYFTKNCGELDFHQLKYNRETKKPRGFGFIRFKTEEAAKEALNGKHTMDGRELSIRMSKKKEEPFKIFVGKLPREATQKIVTEYFSEFGDLDDIFVPNPWRGFAFVTFSSKEDGLQVLKMSHSIQGQRITVTIAEPKPQQGGASFHNSSAPGAPGSFAGSNYDNRGSSYDKFNNRGSSYNSPYQQNPGYNMMAPLAASAAAPPIIPQLGNDLSNELKTMLYALLQNQK